MMDFSTDYETHAEAIAELFASTFTASEGAEEGALIGALARRLIAETPPGDLRVFTAWEDGALLGGIFFTRLTYAGDPRTVFLMAPVAVATAHQGKGVGQRLIAHGLDALRHEGVDIAVTYGDPAFYGRVGLQARLGSRPARAATARPAAGLDRPIPDRRAAHAAAADRRAASPPSTTPRSGSSMVRDYSAFLPGAHHERREPRRWNGWAGARPSPGRSTPMR
jgi:putative acetyltransferase